VAYEIPSCLIPRHRLAGPSTLSHLDALVEYVEIWNRRLANSLPWEVMELIGYDETRLYLFNDDLKTQTERLRAELKG
jgi:hypothetical protein